MNYANCFLKSVDGETKLSANFKVKEFACKDGSDVVLVDSMLAFVLQNCRDYFGKPLTINSGYRTIAHNKSVGGANSSYHCRGMAADISIAGVSPERIAAYLEIVMPNTGGIGVAENYVHVDTRETKSRWTY